MRTARFGPAKTSLALGSLFIAFFIFEGGLRLAGGVYRLLRLGFSGLSRGRSTVGARVPA